MVVLAAAAPAVTCLVAGWLLRSWRGLVAASAAYVVAAALIWVLAVGGGRGEMAFVTVGFVLYIVVPAVARIAVGTAIGMYNDARAGQHSQTVTGATRL